MSASSGRSGDFVKRNISMIKAHPFVPGSCAAVVLILWFLGGRTGAFLALALGQVGIVVLDMYLLSVVLDLNSMSAGDTGWYAMHCTSILLVDWLATAASMVWELGLMITDRSAFSSWIENIAVLALLGMFAYDTFQHLRKVQVVSHRTRIIDPTTVWKTQPQFRNLSAFKVFWASLSLIVYLVQMGFHFSNPATSTVGARFATAAAMTGV